MEISFGTVQILSKHCTLLRVIQIIISPLLLYWLCEQGCGLQWLLIVAFEGIEQILQSHRFSWMALGGWREVWLPWKCNWGRNWTFMYSICMTVANGHTFSPFVTTLQTWHVKVFSLAKTKTSNSRNSTSSSTGISCCCKLKQSLFFRVCLAAGWARYSVAKKARIYL